MHINSACMYCLKPMNIVHCKECLVLMPAASDNACMQCTKQDVEKNDAI